VHIGHFLERFLALYFMFSVKHKGQQHEQNQPQEQWWHQQQQQQ